MEKELCIVRRKPEKNGTFPEMANRHPLKKRKKWQIDKITCSLHFCRSTASTIADKTESVPASKTGARLVFEFDCV